MATTKQTPCFCQSFEFGEFDGDNEAAISYDTNCSQATTRIFAQGHDAKLAGYLVRAEMSGEEIRMVDGGMAIYGDALSMAAKVSEAFQAKVQAMLDAAKARLAKKELAEARKAARKSAKKAAATEEAPKWRAGRIKVGRWTYDAQIEIATGDATYAAKMGGTRMADSGTYTEM